MQYNRVPPPGQRAPARIPMGAPLPGGLPPFPPGPGIPPFPMMAPPMGMLPPGPMPVPQRPGAPGGLLPPQQMQQMAVPQPRPPAVHHGRPPAPMMRPAAVPPRATAPQAGMQQQVVHAGVRQPLANTHPSSAAARGSLPGAGPVAPKSLEDARERDARERNKRMRTEPEPRRNSAPLSSSAPPPKAQPTQPVQPAPAPVEAAAATPPGRKLNNTPAWMAQQPKPAQPPSATSAVAPPEVAGTTTASPLPPDWVELPIFYNTATGQCSWERPRLVVMAGNREL